MEKLHDNTLLKTGSVKVTWPSEPDHPRPDPRPVPLWVNVLKGPNWTTLGPVLMLQLWLLQVHSLFCLDPHKYRSVQVKFCNLVSVPQDTKWAAAGKSQCICECVGVALLARRYSVKEQRSDWWWTNKLLFVIFVASGCARNLPTGEIEKKIGRIGVQTKGVDYMEG